MLKEKLNTEKNIIEETDITGFFFDETNLDFPETNEPNVDRGIDLDKYELIVNTEDDVLYFKEDDGSPLEIPATVEYKDGQTVWLQVPIKLVKERFDTSEAERQAKQAIEDEKRPKEKDALNRSRDKFNQQTKDMIP